MMKYIPTAFVAVAFLLQPVSALAWDGIVSGKVTRLEATSGYNFAIRVYLDNATQPLCTGGPTWAYMNINYDNYQATLSLLTSAWLAGRTVVVHSNKVNGYCEIGFVVFY